MTGRQSRKEYKEVQMNRERWMVAAKKADFRKIAGQFRIDQVTARLIRNRDVIGEEAVGKYLHGGREDLYLPETMKNLPEAAEILKKAIQEETRIRIIGDYDIDGVMSSCILLKALRSLGACVDVRIPERLRDGYGLNENLVRQAAADGIQLLLTCDNGIAAAEQIALANQLGMKAVVTDHHEIPFRVDGDGNREYLLPPAEAVIDPKRKDETYPFPGLCGAAVAWKLVDCLYRLCGRGDAAFGEFIEYVAIATVGDVMELKDENRILVREGLLALHHTQKPGLLELILQNQLEPEDLDVYHIGFILGPCLNASGRLDTAARALRLMMAETRQEAAPLAQELISLNASRKEMTVKGEEEAVRLVEESDLIHDRVLVVFMPDCHESLAGIIAGRLKEHFYRPSFVLTRTADGVKGSGRSIEAYSMYEELCRCGDLLTKFGGHPMAAGISLPEENVGLLREKLNRLCALTETDLTPKIVADMAMPFSYVTPELIREMDLLKPFGNGNPKPLFAQRDLRPFSPRVFGKNRNVVKLQMADAEGRRFDAVYFGDGEEFVSYCRAHPVLSVLYSPSIDIYMGRNTLQMTIRSYR